MANNTKITTKTLPITPYRLYQMQLRGLYKAFSRPEYNYIPPSLGGIQGQRKILENDLVMTIADFEVGNE